MKVLVIGSGIIGVTTAYVLRHRCGFDVTVIDREDGPGREASFANGALLTPSMSDPWNAPGSWRTLLASLGQSDAPLQLRLRALPTLMGWGIAFLRNSKDEIVERNALINLRLALYSLEAMKSLLQHLPIEYGHQMRGSLRVFRDHDSLSRAYAIANRRLIEHESFRKLTCDEIVELEPALAPIAGQLVGAIHYKIDEVGNAFRFCEALAQSTQRRGVEFRFRTAVSSFEVRSGRVTAALSGGERFVADRYIVAAGSYSTPLLRSAGIRLPVQPAKGYSITFEAPSTGKMLSVPVVDDHLHAGIVPLENTLRVVGTAEFAGYDRAISPDRIRNLLALLPVVLPETQLDHETAIPWCGLRPMSADGVPIVGETSIPNLLLNTGHGHLGWTMAVGSAQLLADIISGAAPSIDPAPFSLARF
jgi:D-amino-acid dehydrogenase